MRVLETYILTQAELGSVPYLGYNRENYEEPGWGRGGIGDHKHWGHRGVPYGATIHIGEDYKIRVDVPYYESVGFTSYGQVYCFSHLDLDIRIKICKCLKLNEYEKR